MSPLKLLFFLLLLLLNWLGGSHTEARYTGGIPNICMQPPPRSDGMCTIEIEGYYYDHATLDCQMYSTGVCRLTPGQSFGSYQDCIATCVHGQRSRNTVYYRND